MGSNKGCDCCGLPSQRLAVVGCTAGCAESLMQYCMGCVSAGVMGYMVCACGKRLVVKEIGVPE